VVLGKHERKKVVDTCGLERVAMSDDRLTCIISLLCGILTLIAWPRKQVNFIRKQNGVLKVSNPWKSCDLCWRIELGHLDLGFRNLTECSFKYIYIF